jgi:hypothetical protein
MMAMHKLETVIEMRLLILTSGAILIEEKVYVKYLDDDIQIVYNIMSSRSLTV